MKLIKCKICGKEHQGRVCSSFARSTVGERSGAQAVHGFSGGDAVQLGVSAASDKPTVDTPPKPKFNKTAYQRLYMADLRAAKKIGITIREYRERNRDDVSA